MFKKPFFFAWKGWIVYWDSKYGLCFAFNSGHDGNKTIPFKRTKRIGPRNGVRIILNINQKEYRPTTQTAGIRLYVGEQGLYYNMESHGMSIGPGHSYDFVISKKVITRVKSCKKDSSTTLLDVDTKKETHYSKYSLYLCEALCAANAIISRCKCFEYSLPLSHRHRNATMCNEEQRNTCVSHILNVWNHGRLICSKKCTLQCEEVQYNLEMTAQDYPSMKRREEMMKRTNEDPRNNLMILQFYFREIDYDTIEDEVYYKFSNLIADIGGQLGLFNGFSILTVFEILFLFFNAIAILVPIRGRWNSWQEASFYDIKGIGTRGGKA